MIRVFCIFVVFFASILTGLLLLNNPGYVLIMVDHWTVETTLLIAVCLICSLFLVLFLVSKCLGKLFHLPQTIHHWLKRRQTQQARSRTRQGLIEFSEGYWEQAKNHLIKALPNTDAPLLNYLTAARAAQEMGDSQLRDEYLRQAQQCMPEATIAVELTQAQLQLANHQWEQALATLTHLQSITPNHPYVSKLLMSLYQEVRDWPKLIILLPDLYYYKILTKQEFLRIELQTYLSYLEDLIKQNQTVVLNTFLESIPKPLKKNPTLIALYSDYLLDIHANNQAEKLLYKALQRQFDETLITLYGKIPAPYAKFGFIESLLKANPHSAALFLCLGRLAKTHQLWGKSQAYLEKSLKLKEAPETFAELGDLLQQLGEHHQACDVYRQGLCSTLSHEKPELMFHSVQHKEP